MSEETGAGRRRVSKKQSDKEKEPAAKDSPSKSSTEDSLTSPRTKEGSSSTRTRLGSLKEKDGTGSSSSTPSGSPSGKEKDQISPRHKDKESRNKHALSRTTQRQNSIMPIPMPSPDKVEDIFKKLLADLPPMSTAQRDELLKMNPVSKWSFIQANNPETVAKLKDDRGDIADSPTYFIKKLNAQPTNELVKDLRVQLSTQPVAWYKKFKEHKGLEALLDLLSKIDNKCRNKPEGFRLQNEVLRTLKACFHSKVNVEDFASEGGRLKKLILSLDAGDETVRQLTYELLGLIALFADEGPIHLLPAFDFLRYTRSERHRFKNVVDALRLEGSSELIANALVLVNAIVNTQEELEERIALRLELLSLGLDTILVDLKTKYTSASKSAVGVTKDILAQIETFEGDVEQDEEEFADRQSNARKVNFRDPKDLFMGLMAHIKDKEHLYGGFYSIMKHLLEMPTDKIKGARLWWVGAKIIQQLATDRPQINVESDRLVDIEDLLAATNDKVELEKQREDSFVQIETLTAEIETLKSQLKKAQDNALTTGGGSSDAVKLIEVAKLKVEKDLEEKKKDLSDVQKSLSELQKEFENQKSQTSLQIAELREKNTNLTQQMSDTKDRLKDTRRTLERTNSFNIAADKEDLVRNVIELQKDNADLLKQIDELKKKPSTGSGASAGTHASSDEDELLNEIEKLRKKLSDAETRQLETSASVTAFSEKEQNFTKQLDELTKINDALKLDNASLKDLIATAKAPVTINNTVADPSVETVPAGANDVSVGGPPPPGPPPPPGGGPPPPPGGGPGGPPPPAGAMKKMDVGPKPKVPMKNFEWSKLAAAQTAKSVFKDMDVSKVELDLTALENQFGAKVVETKFSAQKTGENKKEQLVTFVDAKRLQNIGIFIQSFKHTYRDMAEAILMINDNIITAEMATKLMDNAPTSEELHQVTEYINNGGGVDKLQNVDKFFYQLSFVPQLVPRLQAIAFKLNFESKVNELKVSALRVKKANKDLEKYKQSIFKLFEVILAVGNFMNSGTARGNAPGFQLTSLNQLTATKSTDNKTTLLEYLAGYFQGKKSYEDLVKLPADLANLLLATKVNWSVLCGDLQEARKGLTDVRASAATVTKSENKLDVFAETVSPAFENYDTALTLVELQVKETDEAFTAIAILYGSSAQTVPPEEFYGLLSTFFTNFDKAIKQVALNAAKADKDARRIKLEEAKKALEEKKAATAIAKEALAKKGSASPTGSPTKAGQEDDGSLESIVSSARSGGENRFRKNLLRRQETLRKKRAQTLVKH